MNAYLKIPDILSWSRFIAGFFVMILILAEMSFLAFIVLLLAALSDIVDGMLARHYNICTESGSRLDVYADFILVFLASVGLVLVEIYPLWILVIFGLMFGQFIVTSRGGTLSYDPLGRYYGTMSMIVIGCSLLLPESELTDYGPWIILIYSLLAIAGRFILLTR